MERKNILVFLYSIFLGALIFLISCGGCTSPSTGKSLKNKEELPLLVTKDGLRTDDYALSEEEIDVLYDTKNTSDSDEPSLDFTKLFEQQSIKNSEENNESDEARILREFNEQEALKKALLQGLDTGNLTDAFIEAVSESFYQKNTRGYIRTPYELLHNPYSVIRKGEFGYDGSTWGGGRYAINDLNAYIIYNNPVERFAIKQYQDEIGYDHKSGDSVYMPTYSDFRVTPNAPRVDGELYVVRRKDGSHISITGFLKVTVNKGETVSSDRRYSNADGTPTSISIQLGERIKKNVSRSGTAQTLMDGSYTSGVKVLKDNSSSGKITINYSSDTAKSNNKVYDLNSMPANVKKLIESIGVINPLN